MSLRIPGADSLPHSPMIDAVTAGYFEALDLRVARGRPLTERDDAEGAPRVAVVNETMARTAFPGGDALGACMIIEDAACATVVGVVEDSRVWRLVEDPLMKYYVPLAQAPFPWPPSRLMIGAERPAAVAHTVAERSGRECRGCVWSRRSRSPRPSIRCSARGDSAPRSSRASRCSR